MYVYPLLTIEFQMFATFE